MPLQAINLTGSVLFSGASFFPYNHRSFPRAIVLSPTILLFPTILLSPQPSLFPFFPHPIILSPQHRSFNQRSVCLCFFPLLNLFWVKTGNPERMGKYCMRPYFRLKPILSKHPIFYYFRSFVRKVMTTAAWAAAWAPIERMRKLIGMWKIGSRAPLWWVGC